MDKLFKIFLRGRSPMLKIEKYFEEVENSEEFIHIEILGECCSDFET